MTLHTLHNPTHSYTNGYSVIFTSSLECTHLVMQRNVHLAQPHLLHSTRQSHESVKSVTDRLVSTELQVCQNSYSTAQVCMCVCMCEVYVWRCTECVQVGLPVQFMASWHSSDLCEEDSQLQPTSWRSDDLRTERTERLVLLSLSPSCLPAVVCPQWETCRAGCTCLKISSWMNPCPPSNHFLELSS